jgi:hypothetical protein
MLAGTVAALAMLPASAAAAITKTVTFDDLAPGTRVSNEYQDSAGVTFVSGNGSLQPYVKTSAVAHSAPNEGVYDCTGLPGCGEGFFTPRMRGVLSNSASSVSAYVGYYLNFGEMDTVQVRIRAYNADDVLQAESGFVTVTENGPLTQVTATAPAATIDYFEIVADALGDNSLGKAIVFDDLSIVTPDAQGPPNFTLNQGEGVANVLAGTSVSLPVQLNRINGSNGNVSFAVSGLPAGMTATFSPNPVTGTGTTTTLTLTAAADAPPSDAYSEITITATPAAGAGPTPRTITKLVRVRTAYSMTVGGPPDVDLAPCIVKVPITFVRDFGFAGPVSLSVSGLANGVQASFEPSQATFPNGAGGETVNLVVTGPSTGFPVPSTVLQIRGSAPGLADRTGSVTVHGTCPAQYDARVTSLEITQGTQSEVLPQRYPDHPKSAVAYSDIPNTARLRRDGPTIVRVYANLAFGPQEGVPNLPLVLRGAYYDRFGQLKALPGSPISPISGLRRLKVGPVNPPASEAASETDVYTFVLPTDWTHANLAIGATILPSLGGGARAVKNCETTPCTDNDNMGLSNIPFVAARGITIQPLQLTVNGVGMDSPDDVFEWARMMLPLAMTVKPYQATIDITDVSNDFTQCKATGGSDCSDKANEAGADRVNDWDCDHEPSDRTYNIGVNTGVARGLTASHWCFGDFHLEHDAVVERKRPTTSVAHELGHLLGRVHADLACGGNSDGQEGEAWPPDDRGLIQSVGLATDLGTGTTGPYAVVAGPKEYFDYMSYCTNGGDYPKPLVDGNAWVSVRNWNRILGDFDLTRSAPAARVRAAAPGPAVASLHVRGFATTGNASIVSVSPVSSPPQPSSNSDFHLIGLDAAGAQVADVGMLQAGVHTDGAPPSLTLDGVIPSAGVVSVAIVQGAKSFDTRARSASAPTVSIGKPPKARRGTATVRWTARDADGGRLLATIDYSTDAGRHFAQVWTGPSSGSARLPARYLSRSSRARLRVTVNDGFREATATSAVFRSAGAPPVVKILSPVRRLKQPSDAPLVLSGQAFDDRGDALTGRRLRWRAGRILLGTGADITATGLRAGRHRIDLLARDGAGRTSRASVVVTLSGARPFFLTLTAPKSVKRSARTLRMKLASSLPAKLTVRGGRGTQRFTVGRRARTVTVRIPSGTKALKLRLTLSAGKLASSRTLAVIRS